MKGICNKSNILHFSFIKDQTNCFDSLKGFYVLSFIAPSALVKATVHYKILIVDLQ